MKRIDSICAGEESCVFAGLAALRDSGFEVPREIGQPFFAELNDKANALFLKAFWHKMDDFLDDHDENRLSEDPPTPGFAFRLRLNRDHPNCPEELRQFFNRRALDLGYFKELCGLDEVFGH